MLKPSRVWRRNIAIASGLVAIYLIYVAVRLIMLASSGSDALKAIDAIKAQQPSTNVSALKTQIEDLTVKVGSVSSIANEPMLAPISWLPGVGKDFGAVGRLASSSQELLIAANPVVASLSTLNDSNSGEAWDTFKSDAIAALPRQIDQLNQALSQTEVLLSQLSNQNLDFGLSQKVEPLGQTLHHASVGLRNLRPLIAVMGPVLSQTEPKTWFVATQNLAEARGTGGILGSFAVVRVDQGKVNWVAAGSDQDLAQVGRVNYRSLPAELRNLWGVENGIWQDMNASMHVPYFATQIVDSVSKIAKIDGVLVLGQGTVAQLVAATGPVQVDGVTIDASNATDFLAKGIYARYPLVQEKNAWLVSFMKTVFGHLSENKLDSQALWNAAVNSDSGDRIAAWSSDSSIQKQFQKSGVSGEVSDAAGSTTYFSFNNGGGNKLDAYLKVKASYSLMQCNQTTDLSYAGRKAQIKIQLTNTAPKKGLPAYVTTRLDTFGTQKFALGSNRDVVSIYAPVGASLRDFTLGGKEVLVSQGFDRSHPVWVLDVSLQPGQSTELVGNWIEPITDVNGRENQTAPVLVAPVSLNVIETSVHSSGYCAIASNQ